MARTYVQAVAERARLLALGRKLQVRIIKNPVRGADANPYPQQGVNDYLLEIKEAFGITQILIEHQLGGRLTMRFHPTGMECAIELPADAEASDVISTASS